MTTATKNTTYNELLARQKALETELFNNYGAEQEPGPLAGATYKWAFSEFLHGEPLTNALKIGRDGSGGFLTPDELEKQITDAMNKANVFRKIAHVIQVDHDRRIPVVQTRGSASWVDEEGVVLETDDEFGEVTLGAHKAATSIKISEELLEDAGFDMESYISLEFARRIGDLEESAFISGTGAGMPLGILNIAPIGAVTEQAGKISVDDMLELFYSVGEKYRANAVWVFSDDVERALRKAKNTIGRPLWEDALTEGELDAFLGRPAVICKSMPDIAPGENIAMFGDFAYFWIADRGRRSFKRLDELYAATGQVGFRATQRVDARLILPEAVKILQVRE